MDKLKLAFVIAFVMGGLLLAGMFLAKDNNKEKDNHIEPSYGKTGNLDYKIENEEDVKYILLRNTKKDSSIFRPVVSVNEGPITTSSLTFVKEKGENYIKFDGNLIGRWNLPKEDEYRKIVVCVSDNADKLVVDDLWGGLDIIGGEGMEKVVINL